jgi:hypothetical protein
MHIYSNQTPQECYSHGAPITMPKPVNNGALPSAQRTTITERFTVNMPFPVQIASSHQSMPINCVYKGTKPYVLRFDICVFGKDGVIPQDKDKDGKIVPVYVDTEDFINLPEAVVFVQTLDGVTAQYYKSAPQSLFLQDFQKAYNPGCELVNVGEYQNEIMKIKREMAPRIQYNTEDGGVIILSERPYVLKNGKREYYQTGHIDWKLEDGEMWAKLKSVSAFAHMKDDGTTRKKAAETFTNSIVEGRIPGLRAKLLRFNGNQRGKKNII